MFSTTFLDLPALAGADGTVRLPGSKSISNRVLLLAALASGTTTIHDLLDSDDTRVMLTALRALGCGIDPDGNTLRITGLGGKLKPSETLLPLFLGNAGTAMRPLTAALSLLGGEFELSGVPRMHERPIGDLVDALTQLGCRIDYLGNPGYPPLRIHPVPHGELALDTPIRVRGDVSSQFLTALLLALPLAAAGDIVIEVVGELISKPYIEITLNLLARFGIQVRRDGWERFTIPAGSQYSSPGDIHVEADASSASYFIALGAIATGVSGKDGIRIEGVGADSIQGDIRFIDAARQMGAQVDSGPNWLEVRRGAWPLKAIDLDANHIPDAAMTLAVMALYADGPTTLRNIASWRVKETDRIDAMANELKKLGASVEAGPDFIRVQPLAQAGWRPASIHTYDDHRVAMCFSLAAFNPAGVPVRILDPHCVAKTFPDYFETLFSVAEATEVPVICIDGPTASGKGTLAAEVARLLGYHYLDSGSLYRVTGLAMRRAGLSADAQHEAQIAALAAALPLQFTEGKVLLAGEDVSDEIRTEAAGMDASRVSTLPAVREALLALQQRFRQLPGLVADGRDMGTVIFPDATLKVFLTASAAERAERRHKQLISKGISTTLDSLRSDLEARDARDSSRSVAPLKPAQDARHLDNSQLSIEQSIDQVLDWWQQVQPFKSA
ncbi:MULTISPECIES: bifunctional 3-phosphoshikimate 1-carboxyvinyltransferase/cytidylate kinase [Variovorax]|jgi:3-phosphoshikimate 1-carboxyvinyltransferase|uniref:bifunctional 3-phosphoshikimate 1-carboxyvinyltransferase/cytidylate kinase n=1 Tax=Variovorax TaxID=34072 RepID=UPI00086E23B1|nr:MULTISPECIES: bifunctional 3-phosphoshikimate 1-carboxyvinyltransferase/cytidylate kinase [Variovorax]MBN8758243.1 bifunctional 3-phosphoshikimate 1-carboxyvinyltransferase/cytidylate kinase [Variovorax sp.]ODU12593.1 MAG: cytidylate kinase [Variovorax sp. SCN 67-85]ODV19393.1 MAG: cytidylate kinase [Variovorax sp. SCN 67-20]OJZ06159.1 MAG: cytidylate kinase [Variovorax sp. 67-131]UKI10537.1 bifunctional 3-phosphoshikimate 1-carboxyvinyltransferase/cytidylate kinase [Variovorax paradoxus]